MKHYFFRTPLKVIYQWVRDDPWEEMLKSNAGGLQLYKRISNWIKYIESSTLENSHSSPSVKSALRQLKQELDKMEETEKTGIREYNSLPSGVTPRATPEPLWHS